MSNEFDMFLEDITKWVDMGSPVNIKHLIKFQVVYRQAIDTIFRMPIYPMLNQWNANPMTQNTGL